MDSLETKRDAFKRLATKRTNAVIEKIRVLGHCANSWQYEYNEEDVRKIFKAIDSELKIAKAKFRSSAKSDFKL
jgi:hypothetical protein